MLDIRLQKTRVYQEVKEEASKSLILRLLIHRFGELPSINAQINALSMPLVEELAKILLDFDDAADLTIWLQAHQ